MNKLTKENMIENAVARLSREIQNAAGFQIDIDTLTGIKTRVTEQKFYTVRPSDYMPVIVGENAWAEDTLTYKSFSIGDDFETGLIETGSNNGRLEEVTSQIEGVRVPRKVWAKAINYNLAELNQAQMSGNWSLIEQKETSRFKNWQLGIQKSAFIGLSSVTGLKGLLTQTGVTSNTAVITKSIKTMTATEFQTFLGGILPAYFANTGSTELPDTFIIPTSDFLGLVNAVDEGFPLKSRLERITESLQAATGNANFEIKPLAYADDAQSGLGVQRYVLYRKNDATSLTMEIPVDYTTTIFDTVNGFQYQSAAYGQFSSVEAFRPKEMLYFDY